jgi:hypothetical protein
MSGKTKPKRVRRVWDRLNPITVALNASTLFTEAEREKLMTPLRSAMTALRQGAATEFQWLQLATAAQVALCIEDLGIVRGLRQHFKDADHALCVINERAIAGGAWRAPTCYGHELVTMDTLLTLYAYQITQLAAGEYRKAVALAKARQLTHGGKVVTA